MFIDLITIQVEDGPSFPLTASITWEEFVSKTRLDITNFSMLYYQTTVMANSNQARLPFNSSNDIAQIRQTCLDNKISIVYVYHPSDELEEPGY
jgi:hypothetical protein